MITDIMLKFWQTFFFSFLIKRYPEQYIQLSPVCLLMLHSGYQQPKALQGQSRSNEQSFRHREECCSTSDHNEAQHVNGGDGGSQVLKQHQ